MRLQLQTLNFSHLKFLQLSKLSSFIYILGVVSTGRPSNLVSLIVSQTLYYIASFNLLYV